MDKGFKVDVLSEVTAAIDQGSEDLQSIELLLKLLSLIWLISHSSGHRARALLMSDRLKKV
jgi:hypothetical protein